MFFHFVPRHENPLLSTRGVSYKKKKTTPTSVKICLTRRRSLFVTGKKKPIVYYGFSQHYGYLKLFLIINQKY